MMDRPLRQYQKAMLRYSLGVRHPAFFVQMRLGKTLVGIRSAKLRSPKRVLMVSPYSAMYGWKRELFLEKEYERGVVELVGPKKVREKLLEDNYDKARWFLINKEGHLALPQLADYHFDIVMLDESTFIKSPYSTRKGCKVSRFFCENFRDADHRYIFTGTPAPESELNYYNQLRFLDHDNWEENTFYGFKQRNFGTVGFTEYISPEGSAYLEDVLARNCFFLTRGEVNLGGKKVFETRSCPMTSQVQKIYNRVEKEMVLEWGGGRLDTVFATTKHIWLRRLCGGFADTEFISYSKLYELQSLLRGELKDEPTVIICKHRNEVEKVAKFLGKHWRVDYIHGGVAKRKREEIQDKFMSGKLDHVIAQPRTIAYGVDLSISDTLIVYTAPDSGEIWMQVQDRIVNTAKNDSSLIIFLTMAGSVEEDRILQLEGKESAQDATRRSVQRLQKKYGLIK